MTLASLAIAAALVGGAQGDENTVSLTVGRKPSSITLNWTLTQPVEAGKLLRLRANGLQPLRMLKPDKITAQVGGSETEMIVTRRFDAEEQRKNWMFYVNNPFVVAAQPNRALPKGSQVSVEAMFSGMDFAGRPFRFCLETSESWEKPWTQVSEWVTLEIRAGKPVRLEAHQRADGRLQVLYTDEQGNPADPGDRRVRVMDADGKELASAGIDGSPAVTIDPPAGGFPERVNVTDDKGMEAPASPRPAPSVGKCSTYFGEIHWHSEFSGDGYRALTECLEYARDHIGLDFCSPGDHLPSRMTEYLDTADRYNSPGRFVTLLGYEVSMGPGHINVYYPDRAAESKFAEFWKKYTSDPKNTAVNRLALRPFRETFKPEEIVIIPHHMNITSGTIEKVVSPQGFAFWREFDWREADNDYVRVAEMIQTRGSFETEEIDKDWRMLSGGYGSSVRSALAAGHRFGFTGGTDNHDGWPTRGNLWGLYSMGSVYVGLTAVQAPELTREAIFQALRNRRTYATSGARIVLDFTLNGEHPMGREAKLAPGTLRRFGVVVKGTAPLERVEIISQGAKLASIDAKGSTDLVTEWTDPRPDAPLDDCYYYLRVRQTDGHCAWSSPIWVDYTAK